MPGLDDLRTAAASHEQQLQATSWLGAADLAARWGVSRDVVLAIPRAQLPYLTFGASKMRRYKPSDVEAFEEREKAPAQERAS